MPPKKQHPQDKTSSYSTERTKRTQELVGCAPGVVVAVQGKDARKIKSEHEQEMKDRFVLKNIKLQDLVFRWASYYSDALDPTGDDAKFATDRAEALMKPGIWGRLQKQLKQAQDEEQEMTNPNLYCLMMEIVGYVPEKKSDEEFASFVKILNSFFIPPQEVSDPKTKRLKK